MKHMIQKGLFASALVLLSSTGFAGSKNVIINANVVGVCEFSTGDAATIDFGPLRAGDPVTPASTTVGFWCSKDTAYTLTTSDGSNAEGSQKNLVLGADKIPYALVLDKSNGTGLGKGTPIDVTLTATIANSALDDVPAGTGYTDTVVLTLTP
ncbi:spore coat U domain-containing protein [Deefgea tanakiae]|uniref:Spore coat U domain-containing protein n=1 Tax=Deefgea tanakiae TaxID=2865840 RepID=A0ABX8Z9R5_9NEIS|nr:spore coat protein U domain-containing protein [Deefgea tanakiae]QZA77858.1 spore coat U domain-containing protein [Deefgea tanakiae]